MTHQDHTWKQWLCWDGARLRVVVNIMGSYVPRCDAQQFGTAVNVYLHGSAYTVGCTRALNYECVPTTNWNPLQLSAVNAANAWAFGLQVETRLVLSTVANTVRVHSLVSCSICCIVGVLVVHENDIPVTVTSLSCPCSSMWTWGLAKLVKLGHYIIIGYL